MTIYGVKHNWNNGEVNPEHYKDYENVELFSSYEKANINFLINIQSNYEGKYTLISWELDTQKQIVIDESVLISCTSYWDEMLDEEIDDYNEEYEIIDEKYYSYHDWFKKVFLADYDKAVDEVISSDRSLAILKIARDAVKKNISDSTCMDFFKVYDITSEEREMFWNEYYKAKNSYE